VVKVYITLLSPSSFAIVHKETHNYSLSPMVSAGEMVNILGVVVRSWEVLGKYGELAIAQCSC
jgi:hypothetical protein